MPLPRAGGAWWTFALCSASGSALALAQGVELRALFLLDLGMLSCFLASEWLFQFFEALYQAVRGGWPSLPRSVPALALTGLAALCLGLGLLLTAHAHPQAFREVALLLTAWAAFSAVLLVLRMRRPDFDPLLQSASALLMTGPCLILGALALPMDKALLFWLPWAWYFPWAAFDLLACLRGNWAPRWQIWAGSLALGLPALLAWALGTQALLWGFFPLSLRSFIRLLAFERRGAFPLRPTEPEALQLLGYEELSMGVIVSIAAVLAWI